MRAAIFDLDGTLIDSMYYWRMAPVEYMRMRGIAVGDELAQDLYAGRQRFTRDMAVELMPEGSDIDRMFLGTRDLVAEHYKRDIHLKPGAAEYLALLKSEGVMCILATATWRYMSVPMLQRMGIAEYFMRDGELMAVCADELGFGKSSPDYFPTLLKRFGLRAEDATMYEDALYAMKSAHAVGLKVFAIEENASRATRDEIKALADRYFYSWSELCEGRVGS